LYRSRIAHMREARCFVIAAWLASECARWRHAIGAALSPVAALLPQQYKALVAVPVGVALAGLGYALWSERREPAATPVPGSATPQLRPTAAE
jgi:hypothetical protein